MKLIFAEKPEVARSFANELGCGFCDGYHKGNGYIVTNCIGHFLELFMPQDYAPRLATWSVADLPIVPKVFKYKEKDDGYIKKQFNIIKKAFKENDIDEVIVATDPGREGELIARLLFNHLGIFNGNYSLKRFWTSESLTSDAIKNGLKNVRPLSDFDKLYKEGKKRAEIDWLIGINYSRLLSCTYNDKLTFGRVQSVVLKKVYDVDMAIKNFVSSFFYSNSFFINQYQFSYTEDIQKTIEKEADRKAAAEAIDALIRAKNQTKIDDISVVLKTEKQPKLYSLTDLQKDANRIFGFSFSKTLDIAQTLYEKDKILSYPRTPSSVLSETDFDFFVDCLRRLKIDSFAKNLSPEDKNIFNSKEVEDHHALVLLNLPNRELSDEEQAIFDLVLSRMKQVLSPAYEYDFYTATVFFTDKNEKKHAFKSSVKSVINLGWKEFEIKKRIPKESDEEEDETETQFDLEKDVLYPISKVEIVEKKTKPISRLSQADIGAFMQRYKLGSDATRYKIIDIVLDPKRNYAFEKGNKIFITDKGESFVEQLLQNEKLLQQLDYDNTLKFEELLLSDPDRIEPLVVSDFKSVKEFFEKTKITALPSAKNNQNPSMLCPMCGQAIKKSRFGFYCGNKGCFSLSVDFLGAKISEDDVLKIISGKKSKKHKMVGKSGKSFNAKLYLDLVEKKIKMDFVD